ncbi:hypothetical protein AAG570_006695 [Ranatra chinensis]|uniref:glutathione transferase n=1 Tax=Ranatra chinensis TaxID=642074 RepID=A0ABD0Z7H1_9HEMI
MPTYKLTYFNFMGLAEPIRLILKYMGQEFEDVRIERSDWPQVKEAMPFGKVPVLEIDGKKIHQSTAICRYLGKQAGIAGKNDKESLEIDMIVDTFQDFRMEIVKLMQEQDPEAKEKKKETLIKETVPYYLAKFDEVIKNNGGHLVNGSLSWGDIYIISLTDSMTGILKTDIVTNYPNIQELKKKVFSIPKIKAWVDKRPKTDF